MYLNTCISHLNTYAIISHTTSMHVILPCRVEDTGNRRRTMRLLLKHKLTEQSSSNKPSTVITRVTIMWRYLLSLDQCQRNKRISWLYGNHTCCTFPLIHQNDRPQLISIIVIGTSTTSILVWDMSLEKGRRKKKGNVL